MSATRRFPLRRLALALPALLWGCDAGDPLQPSSLDPLLQAARAHGPPPAVSDLSASDETTTAITVTWTQVEDGAGREAWYELRYGLSDGFDWSGASVVSDGTCASPIKGQQHGGTITCTVDGLEPATSYSFQVSAFSRGGEGGTPVLSNVVSGTTLATETDTTATASTESTDTTTTEDSTDSTTEESTDTTTTDTSTTDSSLASIAHHPFDLLDEPGWLEGTANGGRLELWDGAGRMIYPAGWEGGYAPGYVSYESMPTDTRTVRVTTRTRLSSNWQGHSVANKWGLIWTAQNPRVIMQIVGEGDAPLYPEIWLQGVPMEDSPEVRNLGQNLDSVAIQRGIYFTWTVELQQNTGDNFDGRVRWWINGVLVGDHSGLRFTSSSETKHWDIVQWRPVWGGSGGTTADEQWMEADYIDVEGQ